MLDGVQEVGVQIPWRVQIFLPAFLFPLRPET